MTIVGVQDGPGTTHTTRKGPLMADFGSSDLATILTELNKLLGNLGSSTGE
ncbi:hypothetical protein GCM10009624_15220 [Gordonia sinesedis]